MRSTIARTVRRSLSIRQAGGPSDEVAGSVAPEKAHRSLWQRVCSFGSTPDDPHGEAGMATAEYAIGTLAAAAFAGLLLAIMRSGSLRATLQGIIESALNV